MIPRQEPIKTLSAGLVAGVAALLLPGCAASVGAAPQNAAGAAVFADASPGDIKKPGVTCTGGLRFDEGLGCTREAGPGEVVLRLKARNEMSHSFVLVSAAYALDGHVLYASNEEAGVAAEAAAPVLYVAVPPGGHALSARLTYRGHGEGVFSYLKGYKFEVRSSHTFTVTADEVTEMTAIGYEKGDVRTPIEERPAMRWIEGPSVAIATGPD